MGGLAHVTAWAHENVDGFISFWFKHLANKARLSSAASTIGRLIAQIYG
jgi:hypothetical protein